MLQCWLPLRYAARCRTLARQGILHVALAWVFMSPALGQYPSAAQEVWTDGDGVVHLPPMSVPFSGLASPEAKAAFAENQEKQKKYREQTKAMDVAERRKMFIDYAQPALKRTNALYQVKSEGKTIGGVYADIVTPREGIAARNKHRVLINLHGGGFVLGARVQGALESIPVAGLGKIKVIAVDYRQGPEYKFPAATEDVIAVYRELLKTYKSQSIGIYGCSAGGVLTAETMAWIEKENLPAPGAIGIFCASAAGWAGGDSGSMALPLSGVTTSQESLASPHPEVSNASYFSDADFNDPLVIPSRSTEVLARFPPTLIVTSTRDVALSPAVSTHALLIQLGVDAELHVWEGLGHSFFTADPDLPETKEVWAVVTRFFDKHLAGD